MSPTALLLLAGMYGSAVLTVQAAGVEAGVYPGWCGTGYGRVGTWEGYTGVLPSDLELTIFSHI